MELNVGQVMQPQPRLVRPDATVSEVLHLMNEHRIGSVLITTVDGELRGIFTERDLLRRIAGASDDWRELPVEVWMTANPHTISPHASFDQAMTAMQKYRVRHLPVMDGDTVVGILSTRHLMHRRTEYLNQRVEERTREWRLSNEQLLARDAELSHSLKAAGKLQNKLLLPNAPPDWADIGWAVHYAPLDHLGGDYYDFAQPDADHLGILIADASGHSAAAALVAIMARFAFDAIASKTTKPGEVLTAMNDKLLEVADERFVTAFYGVLNRRTRVFRYANAGHPYPFCFRQGTGEVTPLAAQGFMLGIIPGEMYSERAVVLNPGDTLCFYTDGLVEARNEIGEQYGDDRLTRCLRNFATGGPAPLLQEILACQKRFCSGVPLADDLTVALCQLAVE